jgi:hypothetical protein
MSVEVRALVSIVAAIVAAAVVLLAAGRFRFGGALALLASFIAGSLVQMGEVPSFPSRDWTTLLLWSGLVAGALGVASRFVPRAGQLPLLGLAPLVMLGATLRLLIGTSTFPGTGDALLWIVGWSALAFVVTGLLDVWASRNEAGPTIALPLMVVAAGGGVALAADSGMKQGIQAASLSAALGVSVAYSLWKSANPVGRGALAVALSLLPAIWAVGHFADDFSRARSLVLTVAPLLVWVTEAPFLKGRRPWLKGAVAAALVLVPVAILAIPVLAKAGEE